MKYASKSLLTKKKDPQKKSIEKGRSPQLRGEKETIGWRLQRRRAWKARVNCKGMSLRSSIEFGPILIINWGNIINRMGSRQAKPKHKKRYSKISTQKRLKLAKMVLEEGLTLTKVAKLLHIKRPTAKVILKRYKENGTFFHKKICQVRTKDSIASNQQLKIEEVSHNEVSIEMPPSGSPEVVKQQPEEPRLEGLVGQPEQAGFVIYYPLFGPYQAFM